MSWDLDEMEAVDLAHEHLEAMDPPGDDVWIITAIEERDWGWIVHWTNERAFNGSRDPHDLYAGGGPLLIDMKSGRVAMCGSAEEADHYADLWRRGEWPDRPRPT